MMSETDPRGPFRYCIPCTYHGDRAYRNEAAAFVCGVIAATLSAIAQPLRAGRWRRDSLPDDFDVFVELPHYLWDAREPDLPGTVQFPDEILKRAISISLEAVTWPGTSVEIGCPLLVGDALSLRLAADRAAQAEA